MDDDYDILANVNKFCNTNIRNNNCEIANSEEDDIIDRDLLLQLGESPSEQRKTKKKNKKVKSKKKSSNSLAGHPEAELPAESIPVPVSVPEPVSVPVCLANSPQSNVPSVPVDSGNRRRNRRRRNARTNGMEDLSQYSQLGRTRRNYMQELAARLPTVDTIDLISSPLPVITGVVNVDVSDEEDQINDKTTKGKATSIAAINADLSFDSDNPEISVKVKWSDNIERFQIRKHQKFADLLKIFSERENVAVKDVILNLDDHIIGPNDSPDSINYKIYQFISGRIIKNSTLNSNMHTKKEKNILDLKIQLETRKKPLIVKLKKSEKFKILYIKCAEELKVPSSQVKLSFDGEILNMNETPDDLDLEGGEIFDCRLKKE